MKIAKISYNGSLSTVWKGFFELPQSLIEPSTYPKHLFETDCDCEGDCTCVYMDEEEWLAVKDMVESDSTCSGFVCFDEMDIVFGRGDEDYDKMKQVMLQAWTQDYHDLVNGMKVVSALDRLEWNQDRMVVDMS